MDNILPRIFLVVTSSYRDHVITAGFSVKKVLSFENLRTKLAGLSVPNLWHMLRTICNASSCFLFAFKYHIYPENISWLHRRIATMYNNGPTVIYTPVCI